MQAEAKGGAGGVSRQGAGAAERGVNGHATDRTNGTDGFDPVALETAFAGRGFGGADAALAEHAAHAEPVLEPPLDLGAVERRIAIGIEQARFRSDGFLERG